MENYSKVYTELYEIFKHMPKEQIDKLPQELKHTIKRQKDNDYLYEVTNISDFENQKMMTQTRAILAVLYRDYWATKEERERIKEEERKEITINEEIKKEKYSYENIFKEGEIEENQTIEENLPIAINNKNIFIKIIEFIKNLFKRKK